MKYDAAFSRCRIWRYTLVREWDDSLPRLLFVLLNPSVTDDVTKDDPTNKRGMRFATDWGFGSCVFVNLFAYRTSSPQVMKNARDPIGSANDSHIIDQANQAQCIVAAWGGHGSFQSRAFEVRRLLKSFELFHLGLTMLGEPRHPLYLLADTQRKTFTRKGEL